MTRSQPCDISVTVLAARLGVPTPLRELATDVVDGQADLLRAQGYDLVRIAPCLTTELALSVTPGAPGGPATGASFDTIVLCSDSADAGAAPGDWCLAFQRAAGLDGVRVLLVTGSACANFALGLEVAGSLIATRASACVLVVLADRIVEGTRYTAISRSVYSDGAVSCLVTAGGGAASYGVLGNATVTRAYDDDVVGLGDARSTVLAMRKAARRALGDRAGDVRHVVTLNLGEAARTLIAMAIPAARGRLHPGTIDTVGHCFAADIALNLRELERAGLADGDVVLALASSRHALSAVALQFSAGVPNQIGSESDY